MSVDPYTRNLYIRPLSVPLFGFGSNRLQAGSVFKHPSESGLDATFWWLWFRMEKRFPVEVIALPTSGPLFAIFALLGGHTTTTFRSCSMVSIFPPHHSGRFARTIASAIGGQTAFPQRAICLSFLYSLPM